MFNPYMMAAGGMVGGGLGNMFGFKNPSDAASPYMNQIQPTLEKYMHPYTQAGEWALPQMQQQYAGLINDPTALMNKIGQGYQASPGYQYNVDQATKAANQAAAAGGMVGSPAEQQALAGQISGMVSQDYGDYLSRALGMYGQGLSGMQGIGQMGYGAASNLSESLANALASQAQLAYAGQNSENQNRGGSWGSLIGGLAGLFG